MLINFFVVVENTYTEARQVLSVETGKVGKQYFPDLKGKFMNFRLVANSGHPTKSLRYYSGKVRDRALTPRSPGCWRRT